MMIHLDVSEHIHIYAFWQYPFDLSAFVAHFQASPCNQKGQKYKVI